MAHTLGLPDQGSPPGTQDEMLNIGPQELLIILIIALIVVGPQRLPTLGRSIGRGLRELRKAQDEVKRTIKGTIDEETSNDGRRKGSTAGPQRGALASIEDERDATPPSEGADAPPSASEPLPASEVRDISRSLGRSLSELRRARDEVQRSFHVGLNEPTPKRPRPPAPSPRQDPSEPHQGTDRDRVEGPAPDGPAAE